MGWSSEKSKLYCRVSRIVPRERMFRILGGVQTFLILKKRLFLKLKSAGIEIPNRSTQGSTLLETLLHTTPPEFHTEIRQLIEKREEIVFLEMPYLMQVARRFIQKRLHKKPDDLLASGDVARVVEHAARQGIDRMQRLGMRVDFVISAVQRLLPRLRFEMTIKSISPVCQGATEYAPGVVREDRLVA